MYILSLFKFLYTLEKILSSSFLINLLKLFNDSNLLLSPNNLLKQFKSIILLICSSNLFLNNSLIQLICHKVLHHNLDSIKFVKLIFSNIFFLNSLCLLIKLLIVTLILFIII